METKRLRGHPSADFSYCKFRSDKLRRKLPAGERALKPTVQEVAAQERPRAAEAELQLGPSQIDDASEPRGADSDARRPHTAEGRNANAMPELQSPGAPPGHCGRAQLAQVQLAGRHLANKRPNASRQQAGAVLVLVAFLLLNLIDWRQSTLGAHQRRAHLTSAPTSALGLFELILGLERAHGPLLAAGQHYKPEWPQKLIEQEIFLLNLEDGYFGCQVNASQDFLQLFELSRLCDGQPQCYLGSDELASQLKCRDRDRCESAASSPNSTTALLGFQGREELVKCVNGVCLDGLCYCNDGYGGKSCDIPDENECKFRPCDVFAHCTNTMGSYYCSCFPDINECEIPSLRALCSDNSECVNLPGHFVCKCRPGYQQSGLSQSSSTGAPIGNATVQCSDIDECAVAGTCGKGATCENLPGSFRCACPPGFSGDPAVECFDMDECRNNPCGLGAQCTNMPGGFRCSCAPGHERNPSAPAHLFGTIQFSELQQLAELTNSSQVACLDVNECQAAKSACGQGAQCVNTQGGYFCQCPPGFSGNPKVACLDIDECAAHACGPNTQCKNTPGSYKCECKPGYTGNAYLSEGCQDEDECLRQDACGLNAQCFNTLGGFQCSCQSGFAGDPYRKCTDIDECHSTANPCGPGAQCVNLEGGYKCACADKYLARGTPEMGCERAAVDIGCQADFDCTQNAQCLNSTCQCKLGFQISGIECVDVDECAISLAQAAPAKPFTRLSTANSSSAPATSSSGLCGPEATCLNTEGSYRCECRPGYERVEAQLATSKCRDINECERSSPCGQNAKCFNTDGAFKCLCNDGFIPIDSDPANGCKSPCEGVNCGQHATCKPHGEEAACVCKPGFTFDPSNIKLGCVDINECDTNYGPSGLCGQRAVCTNVPGSYRCSCPAGYAGDAYRYCEDINECDRKFGVFGQCGELAVCTNRPGSFSCACAPGYTGDPKSKCTDVDECSSKFGPSGKCGLNALCTNTPGKFSCACPPGYTGDPQVRCTPERPTCGSSADCAKNQVCQSGRCACPFAGASDGAAGEECRHPCEKTECGAHATCQLDSDNQPLCVCDSGFMAPSDGRSGCVDVNECIQGVALSGVTPISTPSGGSVALGPLAAAGNSSGHPCGRNALCRNQPGSFDCVCPPGYSGDAYVACGLDVRNQALTTSTTTAGTNAAPSQQSSTTKSGGGGEPADYQQEPRTTACAEPCGRGFACADGHCVRRDTCRDLQDCRPSETCELVSQALGFQCVGVCDSLVRRCGPGAKCTAHNHKAVCSCNSPTGNPYDLVNGCTGPQQQALDELRQTTVQSQLGGDAQSQQVGSQVSTTTKQQQQEALDFHLTTASGQQHQGGDISTVSFGYSAPPATGSSAGLTAGQSTSSLDELQRQQAGREPSQPLIAYELPLQTTPLVPQFDSTPTRGSYGSAQQQFEAQNVGSTGAAQQQFGGELVTSPPRPASQTTTITSNTTSTTLGQTVASDSSQFSNKRVQQQQQSQALGDRQDIQVTSTTSKAGDEHAFGQFSNKSAQGFGAYATQQHKQVACTSDQHCPGNLFCLSADELALGAKSAAGSKLCGCPLEFGRDGDFCYLHRVNCTGPAACKAREECVQSVQAAGQARAHQASSQQFALSGAGQGEPSGPAPGICVCPRGYKLTLAGLACVDRNECEEGTPCALGAVCQNNVGSYECVCPPGTLGEPYTKTCEPIVRAECQTNADCATDRECDLGTRTCISPCHVCGPRAQCTASNHAAICLCPPRYTGNAIDKVYGCQEPVPTPPTTTTTSAPPARTDRPASPPQTTAVGVPVTTLLPASSTTAAPLETTTVDLPEYRTIPPTELFVMCLADGIHVDLQLERFDGIIYVKGHSQDPKCRKLVMSNGSANQMVDFKVQFGHCDLIHRDGEAGFVLVIQKHPKLVTYRARAYHVKCVYNTGERTVTLGFNVSMITTSGTIANTGPPPTCLMSITALDGREVTSAEIGQDLLLRVDVQPDAIYDGFARSCEAKTMDDEGEYQYEVTDANGCATDPSIFSDWKYDQQQKSLVARFNAFKFPSSNNLRFQCNIRVCFGSCPAVNCNGVDAHGKRRRRREAPAALAGPNSTIFSEEPDDADTLTEELVVSDTFKEGALREEIMVQSNAILTFDKKEASLPQRGPPVEDIEFVCLPRLGIVLSILLTTLLALFALAIATSCWCFARKKRDANNRLRSGNGPLPHPHDFPNPLMRSTSASTLRESLYGP